MKELTSKDKFDLIKKYYKRDKMFFELSMINYEKNNFYIVMNYLKKLDSYRLSWFDLETIEDRNIEKYISCMYIGSEVIESIKNDFSKFDINTNYCEKNLKEEDKVVFKANIATKNNNSIDISFNNYLPISLSPLIPLFAFIFHSMPKMYEPLFHELLANFSNSTEKYEYKKEFEFDLFEGDIDKLFKHQIVERGKRYYEENKIKFLEKIEDRYFAVVEGNEKYLTIIKYIEEKKIMQVFCTCPCEFYCKHMYAVILAIRNHEFKRFYKIIYRNPNKDLLQRVMELDYSLCLGIVEQNFEIINDYGVFELVPILDKNDRYNWEVLEDSEDETLTNEINYFLDNINNE